MHKYAKKPIQSQMGKSGASKKPTSQGQRAEQKVEEVLSSPGRPLDSETRGFMESRFGQDFSHVRIHADSKAAEAAELVEAKAYTVGSHIVFGAGRSSAETRAGRQLLAHELTHVLQQRGTNRLSGTLGVSNPGDATEHQAEQIAQKVIASPSGSNPSAPSPVAHNVIGGVSHLSAPVLQREPTKPRAATGTASLADLATQTAGASGKVTAGSLSRQEWESLFSRHFTELDKVENLVESSQARYLFSKIYGWIDAQHFFAHIQFAEEKGLQGATDKGLDIEGKQELVRLAIGPDPADTSIYSDLLENDLVDAADFIHYREGTFMALSAAMKFLSAQEKALITGFDDEKLAKVILDNAKSAWSYEDLVSNQLGVQFFRWYGSEINAGKDAAEVRQLYLDKMREYFFAIQIVNDPATIKTLGAKLPGKERWKSPKMTEAEARKKHPELFEFANVTHRVRVVIHNSQADAEKGKEAILKVAPNVPGLQIEPLGSQFAIYTGAQSHFGAIVWRAFLSKAIPINLSAIVVEPVAAKAAPKP
jgi:hypothetical protein